MYISSGKIFSKWFLESLGLEGLVKMLEVYEDKSAEAFCTIAYTTGPGSEPIMFYGSVKVR
jgi:inosine triphosphate pyrophosphatase